MNTHLPRTALLVGGMLLTSLPAFAQGVRITPLNASGYVHADNEGSAVVDVDACASFDQPVRYVEARVTFINARGSTPGVALISKPGIRTTFWCGAQKDLPAGPPGTVRMEVTWSAHNGNGLSMGHANATGSFVVPGPPPVRKFTEKQKRRFARGGEYQFAISILAGVSGLILAVVFGPVSIGLLAGAALAGATGVSFNLLALDPPDPNYAVTVVPQPVSLPHYVAGNGISPAAADALNSLRESQENQISLGAAMVAALYKAQGAAAAGDNAWEATQSLATADFARRLALALQDEAQLRRTARSALEAGGFPVVAVTEAQAAEARDSFDSPGMPASVRDILTLNGRYPEVALRMHALARATPSSKFVQQNVLDLLAPPPGGPAQNELDLANAEAAAALLEWSDTLRSHPVGAVPEGPPIIDTVQPNQGVAAGGMMVTISGANLLDTERVNFGTRPATGGTCTETTCTVFAPPGTGTVNVTAVGPGGTSEVTAATRFTYVTATTGPVRLAADTLVTSGGFEPPGAATVSSFESLKGPTGAAKLGPGWEIVAGSIDLVGPASGQAAEGVQFVDLNGNDPIGPGTISQVVNTLPGHVYRLSFRMAGNPNGDPVVKTLDASFGTTTQSFSFNITGHTNLNLGWVEQTLDTLSCESEQRITLRTTTTGQRGPNVDAVSVVDIGLGPPGACGLDHHAPVAQSQTLTASSGNPVGVTLTATDEDGDPLTYIVVTGPAHGTLSGTGPDLTYTANAGYTGRDSFTFRAVDAYLSSNLATVTITVQSGPLTPQPPTGLYISANNGNTVTFRWTRPSGGATPTGYALEGGINSGQVLASLVTGPAPALTVTVPTGAFYARVHTLSGAGKSAASNEIRVYVNVPVAPSAPANLLGVVDGSTMSLAWRNTFGGGAPAGLLLTVSGAVNATVPLPAGDSFRFDSVPPGSYNLRLSAQNAAGTSASSNTVTLTVPAGCAAPLAPANFLAWTSGNVITVIWDPATSGPAPTGFVLRVRGAFAGDFPTALRALSGAAGPGSYTLSVYAANACGNSPPTAPQVVAIP
jgi:choice-of-anchor C domain-containing protein